MDAEGVLARARRIKMVLLDVDGVMTDGSFLLDGAGGELKPFCAHDGVGIKLLQMTGVEVGFITGRESPATRARAGELGIKEVFTGKIEKTRVYEDLLKRYGLTDAEVAYMGDDLPDLAILGRVGLPATVPGAAEEVRKVALFTSVRSGGRGAVRELAEFIIKAQGRWKDILARFAE